MLAVITFDIVNSRDLDYRCIPQQAQNGIFYYDMGEISVQQSTMVRIISPIATMMEYDIYLSNRIISMETNHRTSQI